MTIQMQQRRDTATNWTSEDPTLAEGEIGFETDTNKLKIGDGTTAWTFLNYVDSAIDHDDLINTHNLTTDIDHNSLTNTHNLTTDISHDSITAGTIANHDTSATGAELDILTDDSMADALHRHSELSASDGTPNPALSVNASGNVGIGTTAPTKPLTVAGADNDLQLFITNTSGWANGKSVGITFGDTTGGSSLSVPYSSNATWTTYFGIGFKTGATSHYNLTAGTGGTDDVGIGGNINVTTLAGASMVVKGTGNVGIGTTAPATSAKLDITSTTGALLVSRMTTAQRDALTAVNGMIIYNSTTNAFNFYENGAWVSGSGLT